MSDPIRLPDGRTFGQVAYEYWVASLPPLAHSAMAEWGGKSEEAQSRFHGLAQAVLAADPARAQALAALEKVSALDDGDQSYWWKTHEAHVMALVDSAIAALKNESK